MIRHQGKEIIAINHLGRTIIEVRHMGKTVWQFIRSCFGSGGWVNEAPYLNDEGWNNG